jgi:uncharacterized membrane protein YfhO
MRDKNRLRIGGWYLSSLIIPIIVVMIAYAVNGIYWNSTKSVLASDAFTQGANFLASFQDVLHGKASLLFNWNAGLGLNYLALYSYYLGGIVTPLVGFFGKDQIPNVFYILILFKIGLAGLSSFTYLRHQFKLKNYQQFLLAISYATMAFGLVNAEQIMWLDVLYLLPMLIWGLDRWINSHRWGLLFISWWLMLVTNFYIAFMVGIFAGLYYLMKLVALKIPNWWINLGQTLGIMTWSTLSSGIIILPVIFLLKRNQQPLSTMNGLFTDQSGLWDIPIKSMVGAYDGTRFGTTPYIYVGLVSLILAITYFFNQQIKGRFKIGYGLLLLGLLSGFYLQFFNLTWQGWHFPAMFLYRYSFLWSFLIIQLAAQELEVKHPRLEAKVGLILGGIMLIATIGSFEHYQFISIWNLVITLLFLVVEVLLIFTGLTKKLAVGGLVAISILELTLNAGLMFKGVKEEWHYPDTDLFKGPSATIKQALPPIKKNELRRLENIDPISRDDSLRFNYGSVNLFSSVINRPFEQKMNQLGFRSAGSNLNMTAGNNTLVMDSILGVQTNLAVRPVDKFGFKNVKRSGKFQVSHNQWALKNGLLVDQSRAEKLKLSSTDNLGNQNQLLALAAHTTVTPKLFQNKPTQLVQTTGQVTPNGLNFKSLQNGKQIIEAKVIVLKNQQAYLSLFKAQGNVSQITIYKNGKLVESYNPELVGQYVNLGSFSKRTTLKLQIKLNGSGSAIVLNPGLITVDRSTLKKQVQKAKHSQINQLNYGKRSIQGDFKVKRRQALMLTIPADPGWQAKINGQKVEVKNVDKLFVLVPLKAGRNHLTMKYIPQGWILGKRLTVIGLISFGLVQIIQKFGIERITRFRDFYSK